MKKMIKKIKHYSFIGLKVITFEPVKPDSQMSNRFSSSLSPKVTLTTFILKFGQLYNLITLSLNQSVIPYHRKSFVPEAFKPDKWVQYSWYHNYFGFTTDLLNPICFSAPAKDNGGFFVGFTGADQAFIKPKSFYWSGASSSIRLFYPYQSTSLKITRLLLDLNELSRFSVLKRVWFWFLIYGTKRFRTLVWAIFHDLNVTLLASNNQLQANNFIADERLDSVFSYTFFLFLKRYVCFLRILRLCSCIFLICLVLFFLAVNFYPEIITSFAGDKVQAFYIFSSSPDWLRLTLDYGMQVFKNIINQSQVPLVIENVPNYICNISDEYFRLISFLSFQCIAVLNSYYVICVEFLTFVSSTFDNFFLNYQRLNSFVVNGSKHIQLMFAEVNRVVASEMLCFLESVVENIVCFNYLRMLPISASIDSTDVKFLLLPDFLNLWKINIFYLLFNSFNFFYIICFVFLSISTILYVFSGNFLKFKFVKSLVFFINLIGGYRIKLIICPKIVSDSRVLKFLIFSMLLKLLNWWLLINLRVVYVLVIIFKQFWQRDIYVKVLCNWVGYQFIVKPFNNKLGWKSLYYYIKNNYVLYNYFMYTGWNRFGNARTDLIKILQYCENVLRLFNKFILVRLIFNKFLTRFCVVLFNYFWGLLIFYNCVYNCLILALTGLVKPPIKIERDYFSNTILSYSLLKLFATVSQKIMSIVRKHHHKKQFHSIFILFSISYYCYWSGLQSCYLVRETIRLYLVVFMLNFWKFLMGGYGISPTIKIVGNWFSFNSRAVFLLLNLIIRCLLAYRVRIWPYVTKIPGYFMMNKPYVWYFLLRRKLAFPTPHRLIACAVLYFSLIFILSYLIFFILIYVLPYSIQDPLKFTFYYIWVHPDIHRPGFKVQYGDWFSAIDRSFLLYEPDQLRKPHAVWKKRTFRRIKNSNFHPQSGLMYRRYHSNWFKEFGYKALTPNHFVTPYFGLHEGNFNQFYALPRRWPAVRPLLHLNGIRLNAIQGTLNNKTHSYYTRHRGTASAFRNRIYQQGWAKHIRDSADPLRFLTRYAYDFPVKIGSLKTRFLSGRSLRPISGNYRTHLSLNRRFVTMSLNTGAAIDLPSVGSDRFNFRGSHRPSNAAVRFRRYSYIINDACSHSPISARTNSNRRGRKFVNFRQFHAVSMKNRPIHLFRFINQYFRRHLFFSQYRFQNKYVEYRKAVILHRRHWDRFYKYYKVDPVYYRLRFYQLQNAFFEFLVLSILVFLRFFVL